MDKTQAFQSYDDRSDAATCAPRLAALRAELAKRGLDGFVVPHSDEYQSEYLPECNERLAWLTSFTGSSAGRNWRSSWAACPKAAPHESPDTRPRSRSPARTAALHGQACRCRSHDAKTERYSTVEPVHVR